MAILRPRSVMEAAIVRVSAVRFRQCFALLVEPHPTVPSAHVPEKRFKRPYGVTQPRSCLPSALGEAATRQRISAGVRHAAHPRSVDFTTGKTAANRGRLWHSTSFQYGRADFGCRRKNPQQSNVEVDPLRNFTRKGFLKMLQ